MPDLGSVVVVGASLAGMRAAEALRREGFDGQLTLVGAETHWPPFDRPPLSKQVLVGKWEADKAVLRTDLDPATDDRLELRLGRRAIDLDAAERRITLDDDTTLDYDGLIIATGATPRTLPGVQQVTGIHVLRTIDDCSSLRRDLDGPAYVTVIGAGFIGCEVAAAARALGHPVALVEALPLPLVRVLGEDIGKMTSELHREHGVELHLGSGVEGIDGVQRVEGVRLTNGEVVKADVVVVGIGVTANTDWLAASGLVIDNGVLCDQSLLAAGAEGVAAAGDVARWPNPVYDGALMRIEHWTNAAEHGEHAARSLLAWARGEEPPAFESIPYFWSEQYGVRFQMVGTWAEGDEQHVVEGDPLGPERKGVIAFVRGDRVIGALCVNRPNRTLPWRKHIEARATYPVPEPE
ncbi:MAG TPA: FAD/NAD(P)-binding oxidoreductase [Acidimicrobiales bacterium]|nr:FAD/NAD(P)-binding oxidoreductase [Acidimicrobiales bacterium]